MVAFINNNGQITIDEDAALEDMARERAAMNILNNALDKLQNLLMELEGYEGETVKAIFDGAETLKKRTEQLVDNLRDSIHYTNYVVEYYKALDQKCRDALK